MQIEQKKNIFFSSQQYIKHLFHQRTVRPDNDWKKRKKLDLYSLITARTELGRRQRNRKRLSNHLFISKLAYNWVAILSCINIIMWILVLFNRNFEVSLVSQFWWRIKTYYIHDVKVRSFKRINAILKIFVWWSRIYSSYERGNIERDHSSVLESQHYSVFSSHDKEIKICILVLYYPTGKTPENKNTEKYTKLYSF